MKFPLSIKWHINSLCDTIVEVVDVDGSRCKHWDSRNYKGGAAEIKQLAEDYIERCNRQYDIAQALFEELE